MDGLKYFGVDYDHVGFGFDTLLQAGAGVAQGAIASKEAQDIADKGTADEKAKLDVAIAADVNAANALARAEVSAKLKNPTAKLDADVASRASTMQERAGVSLSTESQQARTDAADKQLDDAQARLQAKPKDGYQAALVKAWTRVAAKARGGGAGGKDKKDADVVKESWWTRRILGPLPGTAVVVGGVGLFGGIGYAIKRIFFSK